MDETLRAIVVGSGLVPTAIYSYLFVLTGTKFCIEIEGRHSAVYFNYKLTGFQYSIFVDFHPYQLCYKYFYGKSKRPA